MKTISSLITTVLLLFGPLLAFGQNDKEAWVQRFGPASGFEDYPSVAVDASGNIIVAGAGELGYATIKYSPSGVLLWTNYYDGGYGGAATALAVAANGNIFVTGGSYLGDGEDESPQFLTVAYTGEGVPLWTNRYTQAAYPVAIVADGHGDVIVAGVMERVFGDGIWVTMKYSGAGMALWTNVYYGETFPSGYVGNLAVDRNNDVTVVGSSSRYVSNPGPWDWDPFAFAVVKYSSAGTALWTNRYHRDGDAFARAVAISTNGDIFVTGGAATTNDYPNVYYDMVTIKYSPAGVALWTNLYEAPGKLWSVARALALDDSGHVLVAGHTFETNGREDIVTIKYSSDGAALWTNYYAGPTNRSDKPYAVAADANGNVFVTGNSSYYPTGESVTMAYSSGGVPLWTNRYSGNLYYGATDLAVLGVGEVAVAAYSAGEYATIKYDSGILSNAPQISLYNPGNGTQLILSLPTNAIGFTLQSTHSLTPPATWSEVSDAAALFDGKWIVTNSLSSSNKFYRLRRP